MAPGSKSNLRGATARTADAGVAAAWICCWLAACVVAPPARAAARSADAGAIPLPRASTRKPPGSQRVNRILDDLDHSQPRRRADAAWEAGRMRLQQAYRPLRKLITDEEPLVRRNAAYAMGRLGRREAALLLYDRIIREQHPEPLTTLALALGRIGYRTARPLLVKLTRHSDRAVRTAAVLALGHLGDPRDLYRLGALLGRRDGELRQTAARALGLAGGPHASRLLRGHLDDPVPAVRSEVIAALTRLQAREVIPDLIDRLDDSSMDVRQAAVDGLARLGGVRGRGKLSRMLKSAPPELAAKVALAMARLCGPLPGERLRLLVASASNAVRIPAVRAAGLGGTRAVIPRLEGLVRHPHPALRRAAVEALGRLAAHQSTPLLLARLGETEGADRAALLRALARLRAVEARGAALALLEDTDPEVRAEAAHALGEMARIDPRPMLGVAVRLLPLLRPKGPPRVLARAAGAMAALPPPETRRALIMLMRLTLHPDARVRARAARALGHLGDRFTGPALKRLLRDDDPEVAVEATLALGRLKLTKAGDAALTQARARARGSKDPVRAATWWLALAAASPRSRPEARLRLRRVLASAPATPRRVALAERLGRVGSGWEVSILQDAHEAPCYPVRAAASRALSIWPPPVDRLPPAGAAPPARGAPPRGTPRSGVASDASAAPSSSSTDTNSPIVGPFSPQGSSAGGCGCRAGASHPGAGGLGWIWIWLTIPVILPWRSRRRRDARSAR